MVIIDVGRAERCLLHIGYYRLSAYWFSCREQNPDGDPIRRRNAFKQDAQFWDVVDLYVFDRRLRLLFLDAIERIEVSVRTSIALEVGQADPYSYLAPETYQSRFTTRRGKTPDSHFDDWKDKLARQQKSSKEDFVKHFLNTYPASDFPIWIAVELWDFGMLSKMMSGLTLGHLNQITGAYGVEQGKIMAAWLRSLNYTRNVCAHHARLWNRSNVFQPKLSKQAGELGELEHLRSWGVDLSSTYAVAAILQYLTGQISLESTWLSRFCTLVSSFPGTDHFRLQDAGFPDGWESLPLWTQ